LPNGAASKSRIPKNSFIGQTIAVFFSTLPVVVDISFPVLTQTLTVSPVAVLKSFGFSALFPPERLLCSGGEENTISKGGIPNDNM
jgi:hypothetical protein